MALTTVTILVLAGRVPAVSAQSDETSCRRWKAVLLDLSPLGMRIHLPTAWPTKGQYRRFSINADGVVAGSAEVAQFAGGDATEVGWVWSPRLLPGYSLSPGIKKLPGLYETPEDSTESAACDLSDSGVVVGQSRNAAVRWNLAAVGSPIGLFSVSPTPTDSFAAFGIDRVGGAVVAGVTTENCPSGGGGPGGGGGGPVARAFFGDAAALTGTMLSSGLWDGSTLTYRNAVYGFACDATSIWGVGQVEQPQPCEPGGIVNCRFNEARAFRWDGALLRVVETLGSFTVGSEAIRARDAEVLVGRVLPPLSASDCAPRAFVWHDLSGSSPWSEDLHSVVPISAPADSSIALGVRRASGGEMRIAGAMAMSLSASGIVAQFQSAVVWDECDGGWSAEAPLIPSLVHDLDPANQTLWRPPCNEWHALVAYDVSEGGLFVGSTTLPSERVFIATKLTDINADLVVDAFDLASLLAAWGAVEGSNCDPLVQDANLDGHIDAQDLTMLLSDWTVGTTPRLDSFCCSATPYTTEELEIALALSGEGCIEEFRQHACARDIATLQVHCCAIHEILEAVHHASN